MSINKNIIITPNTNQTGLPNIRFVGSSSAPISLSVLDDNTLSFSGSQGQLFSINNNLTSGTIFSVNDVSGIPSIEVDASGTITLGEFGGNVGIGTGTPTHKLTVVGAISASVISASQFVGAGIGGGTPGGTNTTIQFNSGSTFSGSSNLTWDYTSNVLSANVGGFLTIGSSGLQFWKNSSPTHAGNIGLSVPGSANTNDVIISTYNGFWYEQLRVTNTGKVGIGVPAPDYKLEVDGEISIKGGESPNDDRIHIKASDNTVRYTIKTDLDASPSNDLLIFRAANTDNILSLKGDGNVGINKSSANSTLDVNGNTIISGNLTVTGSITELSTRRIKTNIQTINNELNNLYKLNPVSYVRLDDGRKEYGFISEEVKEVYPEFVVGEGINYPKMVSVLVSAVKELTQKVQQQQTEIEIIKSRGNI